MISQPAKCVLSNTTRVFLYVLPTTYSHLSSLLSSLSPPQLLLLRLAWPQMLLVSLACTAAPPASFDPSG